VLQTAGAQRRNFVHLKNVVDCIAALLEHPELPLLHCLGPETPTVREFAELVCRVAFEALGREIVLIAPPAQGETPVLDFHSRYQEIDQSGQQPLEDYVRDMCLYLNAKRRETEVHR
jgi:nucleoside-diphosphate-sugar epimerase